MKARPVPNTVEVEIDGLGALPRTDLVACWRKNFKRLPPKGASRRYLVLGIAYEMQAKRFGGLKAQARRQLAQVLDPKGTSDGRSSRSSTKVASGTRLVREWNGRTHTVDVIDNGYVWNGEQHRSLSAIARAITGARWSGPRFFGTDKGVAA